MKEVKIRKMQKTAMFFVLACLLFAPFVSQATEITPRRYDWIDSPLRDGVQIQIIFHSSGTMSKNAKHFHITVWIRNSSNEPVDVPYPGDRLMNGLVDLLDHNGKSTLMAVPCASGRVPTVLKLANNEMRGFVVDVFQQTCSVLDKHLLKSGAHSIEFMGYKKGIALID